MTLRPGRMFTSVFLVFVIVSFAQSSSLQKTEENLPFLPPCSSDGSVCNILVKNETDGVADVEHVCACAQDKTCSRTINTEDAINFLDGEWFATCKELDTFQRCKPGEVGLVSEMNRIEDPMNFVVLCACPNGYDVIGARWTLDKDTLKAEFFCKAEEETGHLAGGHDNADYLPEVKSDFRLNFENDDRKRGQGLSAFYKRGHVFGDLNRFYKRRLDSTYSFYKRSQFQKGAVRNYRETGISKKPSHSFNAFYKRSPYENLSAFYKRAPFKRLDSFYKRGRFDNLSAFYKRAPNENFRALYKKEQFQDGTLDFNKKDFGVSSFYKRGFNSAKSSFYKRHGLGLKSFYKRSADPGEYNIQEYGQSNLLSSEDGSGPAEDLSSVNTGLITDTPSYHKRGSSWSFYKRSPGFESEGIDGLSVKRGIDGGNSAFYKRGLGSDTVSFYKRDVSDVSPRLGDSSRMLSFSKRGLGVQDSRFYKKDAEFSPLAFSDNQDDSEKVNIGFHEGIYDKTGDADSSTSTDLESDSFDTEGLDDIANFSKRTPKASSFSSFYKRGPQGTNRFYKRGMKDLHAFYKRSPAGVGLNNFYKRSRSDLAAFYKRSPEGLAAFYKRSPNYFSSFLQKVK